MWRKGFFWFVFGTVFLAGTARAEDPLMRLGTGPDYPPFADENMDSGGILTEMVGGVFRYMGYDAAVVVQPWNRLLRSARTGQLDAVYPFVPTAEREAEYLYSDPLAEVTGRFFGRERGINKLEALARHGSAGAITLCRPTGYAVNEGLGPLLATADVRWERPGSLRACFEMLARHRVDLVPTNQATGHYLIDQLALDAAEIQSYQRYKGPETLHLIIPRNHPHAEPLMEAFDRSLAAFKAGPEGQRLQVLIDRYQAGGGKPIPKSPRAAVRH